MRRLPQHQQRGKRSTIIFSAQRAFLLLLAIFACLLLSVPFVTSAAASAADTTGNEHDRNSNDKVCAHDAENNEEQRDGSCASSSVSRQREGTADTDWTPSEHQDEEGAASSRYCAEATTCRACADANVRLYHMTKSQYSCAWEKKGEQQRGGDDDYRTSLCRSVAGWHQGIEDCVAGATAVFSAKLHGVVHGSKDRNGDEDVFSGEQLILVDIKSPHRIVLSDRAREALTSEVVPSDEGVMEEEDIETMQSGRRGNAAGHHHHHDHGGGVPMELSSHPDLAIVRLSNMNYNATQIGSGLSFFQPPSTLGAYTELGLGPKGDAVNASRYYHGDGLSTFLLQDTSDGSVFSIAGTGTEGEWVVLAPGPHDERQARRYIRDRAVYSFRINSDGSVSPTEYPNLVLGQAPYPRLTLVRRDSPNRAIFSNAKELLVGQGRLPRVQNNPDKVGVSLELSSHPGLAVVPLSGTISPPEYRAGTTLLSSSYIWLGVGPAEKAVVMSYDGRLLALSDDGTMLLQAHDMDLVEGRPMHLRQVEHTVLMRMLVGTDDFVINDEGSVSPRDAPHLALGCSIPGIADELVTEYQRQIAKSDAGRNMTVDDDVDFLPEEFVRGISFVVTLLLFMIIPISKLVPWSIWLGLFVYFEFGLVQCGVFAIAWLWWKRRRAARNKRNQEVTNDEQQDLLNAMAIPEAAQQGLREAREAEQGAPAVQ